MARPGADPERTERFSTLYELHYKSVSGYVHRRLAGEESEAPDVIAVVFAVAWRRLDEIPPAPEDRLWLYGVARHAVVRHHRTSWRRRRLAARLAAEPMTPGPHHESPNPMAARVRAAIGRLRPGDQEVLRLVLWDGLTHAEAAHVLGCSENAVGLRLRRAKTRVRRQLELAPAHLRPTPALPCPVLERLDPS